MTGKRASFSKYKLPKIAPNVAPTDDDVHILLEIYRHDIIDSATIYGLLSHRSVDKVRRRLLKLTHARYLHRLPQVEEIYVRGGGSLPATYTLAAKGAKLLQESYGLKPKMQFRRYRERNKSLTAQTILHALEQTRFLVSIRTSAEARDDVEFLYPEEIYERYAPKILQRDTLPKLVSARVSWEGYKQVEGTIPDGFFMLYYPNLPEGRNRRSIFLEIDRAKETIDPSDKKIRTLKFWKDSSILRKFVVYAYALKTKSYLKEFGIPTFQVLTVTTNPGHQKKMQKMYRNRLAGKPHSIRPFRFLFTNFEIIKKHNHDILSVPIEDGEGKEHRID